MCPAAATLLWLGLRLVQQDRDLHLTRVLERQQTAADTVVRTMTQRLLDVQRRVADGPVDPDIVSVRQDDGRFSAVPRDGLAWLPTGAVLSEAASSIFSELEGLELRGARAEALAGYTRWSRHADPIIRAGALMRRARVFRRAGDLHRAMAVYRDLQAIASVAIGGIPADLVARRAICELQEPDAGKDCATALANDFDRAKWVLDRDAWELVDAELTRLAGQRRGHEHRIAAARAAEWFAASAEQNDRSRVFSTSDGESVTLVWRETTRGRAGAIIPRKTLEAWLGQALAEAGIERASLIDGNGVTMLGAAFPSTERIVRRQPAETGLPWTVATSGTPEDLSGELHSRQRMFAAGFAALALLLGGGAYLLWRGIQRELAVARLQTDFVAAVSHEFRTPLTSLRHAVELLQEAEPPSAGIRHEFYSVLARSTERLHRLVESLLDFGRMEAGRRPYVMRAIEPATLVSDLTREFGAEAAARGYTIHVTVAPDTPERVPGDPDALGHALWNLLDNAVKYSPGTRDIAVGVRARDDRLIIEVRDGGLGVPEREREAIFVKFVRGERARTLGIGGTGVGLAIVSHIVRAHDGLVELESEEGKGSTFRLVLPIAS
jgi:signal transduction histidine kinase